MATVTQSLLSEEEQEVQELDGMITKGLSSTLQGSADLMRMLPAGTALLYQVLNPLLMRVGSCENKYLSGGFLVVCSLVSFLLSFTDSFEASNGKVYYGFATISGLWTPQLAKVPSTVDLSTYKLKASDFLYGAVAVLAFFTTSTFSSDTISCFVQVPACLVKMAPTLVGMSAGAVFLMFPSTRHGIGTPLRTKTSSTSTSTSTSTDSSLQTAA